MIPESGVAGVGGLIDYGGCVYAWMPGSIAIYRSNLVKVKNSITELGQASARVVPVKGGRESGKEIPTSWTDLQRSREVIIVYNPRETLFVNSSRISSRMSLFNIFIFKFKVSIRRQSMFIVPCSKSYIKFSILLILIASRVREAATNCWS